MKRYYSIDISAINTKGQTKTTKKWFDINSYERKTKVLSIRENIK